MDAEPTQRPDDGHEAAPPSRGSLGVILACLLLPAIGAAVGVALNLSVVIPALGLGGVQRIVDLGAHIDAGDRAPDVIFIGNSITLEGVDATIVADALPGGLTAENWAINGCGIGEQLAILPRVIAPGPGVVTLSLQVGDLGAPSDVVADKAFAYALGGFGAAWPASWNDDRPPGLSDETIERFRAGRVETVVHFRGAALGFVSDRLRLAARSELREPGPEEAWTTPFELSGSIDGFRLERHVEQLSALLEERTEGGTGADAIARIVETIRAGGSRVLLAIAPIHPEIRDRFGDQLATLRSVVTDLAQRDGVASLDCAWLIDADGFADAVHLNADGRAVYSRALGERLAPMLQPSQSDGS